VFLAEVLGVTTHVVSDLYRARVIKQNGNRGKYKLSDAVPQYLESIRTSGTAEASAKLKIQQERKLAIQNDQAAGLLVRIVDAAEALRVGCLAWRAGAAALPRRVATKFANTTSASTIRQALTHELNELCRDFEKPIAAFVSKRGHPFKVVPAGDNGDKTTARKTPRRVGKRKSNIARRKRGTGKVAK
jgi:hypothetical protein